MMLDLGKKRATQEELFFNLMKELRLVGTQKGLLIGLCKTYKTVFKVSQIYVTQQLGPLL